MSGDESLPKGAHVEPTDLDFRVARASRDDLVALQVDAETRGFSTRWSSVEALLRAVGPAPVYLRPLLRERRHGQLRSYRCLVIYSTASAVGGAVATVDVAPERLRQLPALGLDAESRVAFSRVFDLALGGIESAAKH